MIDNGCLVLQGGAEEEGLLPRRYSSLEFSLSSVPPFHIIASGRRALPLATLAPGASAGVKGNKKTLHPHQGRRVLSAVPPRITCTGFNLLTSLVRYNGLSRRRLLTSSPTQSPATSWRLHATPLRATGEFSLF